MPGRFVILEHDHPFLHWDLLLEQGPAAATWRLSAPPTVGSSVTGQRIADHRLLYLDYEGPVSGDRGHVKRVDAGTWRGQIGIEHADVVLDGRQLTGRATWTAEDAGSGRWSFGSASAESS